MDGAQARVGSAEQFRCATERDSWSGRRLKVLFFIGSMGGGGAERFYATILRRLDRGRFEPLLVMLEPKVAYTVPDDVRIIVLGKARPWHVPASILRLRRVIDETQPDLVFSTMWLYDLIAAEAARWSRPRPPVIARVVCPPDRDTIGPYRAWTRRAYRMAAHVQALGHGAAEVLARELPDCRKHIGVLEDLTDFDHLDAMATAEPGLDPWDRPTVAALGRLISYKRYDLLIDAFARVREVVDARLVVVGEGPLRPALTCQVEALGLGDAVRFVGFRENPYPILARANVFAHAADYEGLCVALIEAQGLGLSAVSTDCPYGPREVIEDGRTGYLVPVGEAAALAARIVELLSDPAKARAMGEAGRARARARFSWAARSGELTDLLERVARRAP